MQDMQADYSITIAGLVLKVLIGVQNLVADFVAAKGMRNVASGLLSKENVLDSVPVRPMAFFL